MESAELVSRLRRAGCVVAEEEARILRRVTREDAELARPCTRREAGELLEHPVGIIELLGERLSVEPGVFVPRQRTALLIELSLAAARRRERPVVLEAYCGAAPVAAFVARRLPEARIHAADVDQNALTSARRNLPTSAALHRGDGFAALPRTLEDRIDVIAAVPPNVPDCAEELMPREVRDLEPPAARLGGQGGLDEVRRLIAQAPGWLAPGGELLIEMHRALARAMADATRAEVDATPAEAQYTGAEIIDGEDGSTAVLRLRVGAPTRSGRRSAPADLVLLRGARDRVDRDFAQPLDVEGLARSAHMSSGHFSRRFREEYGESPYSYLMTRRIERAMTLLRHTDRSVTDICMDVGFSSLGTFSTRFTELLGVPPSVYRSQGAEVLDSMPPCIARRVRRPVRNREAPRSAGT